jgi:DNA-binding transcriptional ArsR family regulator
VVRSTDRLTAEQEQQRKILALLAHPGRFSFLAALLSREDALTGDEIRAMFPGKSESAITYILSPLLDARILESARGGSAGAGSSYYISGDLPEFAGKVLDLLFPQGTDDVDSTR